ncbi:MAG TPA: EamA family transporter [Thermoanaerobaculia bacterium]|nr:EamA family transporter [Thermoanaerobaculia bacterium]
MSETVEIDRLPSRPRVGSRAASGATSAEKVPSQALRIAVALGAIYLVWGSTYLAMRIAIETIPPFIMAGVRYLTAGTLLYAWARWRGAPRPSGANWRASALIGALLLLIGNGGVVWAEQRVASGMAALLISSEPLLIVLLVWLRRGGSRPGPRVACGMLLGFAGLLLLLRPTGSFHLEPAGVAALLIASVGWAAGSLYTQRATLSSSPPLATAMQMLCGGAWLAVASIATGENGRLVLAHVSLRSLLAVAYLIVFGAIIGFTAYVWLLRNAAPVLVSTYAYVNPVVAVFLGWAIAHEPLRAATLAAAAVILAGVALITTAPAALSSTQRPAEQTEPRAGRLSETRPARGELAAEGESAGELEPEACMAP